MAKEKQGHGCGTALYRAFPGCPDSTSRPSLIAPSFSSYWCCGAAKRSAGRRRNRSDYGPRSAAGVRTSISGLFISCVSVEPPPLPSPLDR